MDTQPNICSVCKTQGHSMTSCPQLSDPLKNGFFSGDSSTGHNHEDDD